MPSPTYGEQDSLNFFRVLGISPSEIELNSAGLTLETLRHENYRFSFTDLKATPVPEQPGRVRVTGEATWQARANHKEPGDIIWQPGAPDRGSFKLEKIL